MRTWESFDEFLDYARGPVTHGNPEMSVEQSDKTCGCSFDEAHRLAREGWPEGLAKMQAIRSSIKPLAGVETERLTNNYAESGDEVCVSRFLDGEPEHMIEFQPQFVPAIGRVIKIVLNFTASSNISPDMIFRRGAAAVMLADAIESAGLRTEIVLANNTKEGSSRICYHVTLKKPESPLELDRMAFCLAHVATLRRLFFRVYERESVEVFTEHFARGYGSPTDLTNLDPDDVYIGAMIGKSLQTDADVTQFGNTTLARYTEPVPA